MFTRRIGPLPMWVWLLVGLGLIGVYVYWKRNQASSTATTANASQVPQFVNQVYTNGVPPVAPQPGTTPKCPDGYAWDEDEKKCIREGGRKRKRHHHRGRDHDHDHDKITGTGVTTINPGGPIPIDPGPHGGPSPFNVPPPG